MRSAGALPSKKNTNRKVGGVEAEKGWPLALRQQLNVIRAHGVHSALRSDQFDSAAIFKFDVFVTDSVSVVSTGFDGKPKRR